MEDYMIDNLEKEPTPAQRAYDAENEAERLGIENHAMRQVIKEAYDDLTMWRIGKAQSRLFKWAVLK